MTRLTKGYISDEDPRFSPDGRHIVYAKCGTCAIYVMRANGTHSHEVTHGRQSCDFVTGKCQVDYLYPDWQPRH